MQSINNYAQANLVTQKKLYEKIVNVEDQNKSESVCEIIPKDVEKNVENGAKFQFVAAAEAANKAREESGVQPGSNVERVNKLSLSRKRAAASNVEQNPPKNDEICSVSNKSVNMSISGEDRPQPCFHAGAIFHGPVTFNIKN